MQEQEQIAELHEKVDDLTEQLQHFTAQVEQIVTSFQAAASQIVSTVKAARDLMQAHHAWSEETMGQMDADLRGEIAASTTSVNAQLDARLTALDERLDEIEGMIVIPNLDAVNQTLNQIEANTSDQRDGLVNLRNDLISIVEQLLTAQMEDEPEPQEE